MSISSNLSCYTVADYKMIGGQVFEASVVLRRQMVVSLYTSRSTFRLPLRIKIGSPQRNTNEASFLCEASLRGRKRDPDFSRQNRRVFRSRNRQTEQRDNIGFLDSPSERETPNGPFLPTLSSSSKFHATAAPGPREKEIVELFKKVQAKLRARGAAKDGKRVESSEERGGESENVSSLLKLLRSHSADHEKREVNSLSRREFGLDRTEVNGAYGNHQNTKSSEPRGEVADEVEEINSSTLSLGRPASSYRKKSPVPQFRPQTSQSDESTSNPTLPPFDGKDGRKEEVSLLESEGEAEQDCESELELKSIYQDDDEYVVDNDDDDGDVVGDDVINDEESKEDEIEHEDLRALRLVELRAIAKSRGVKGFSKMKKAELVELLS